MFCLGKAFERRFNIDIAINHNNEKHKSATEFNVRTTTLTNELKNVQTQNDKQVNQLLNKIDLQEQAGRKMNRTMTEKLKKLQSTFEERNSALNSLTSKLSMAEADLVMAEQKCADLSNIIQRLEMEKESQNQLSNMKMKREKEVPIGSFPCNFCSFVWHDFFFRNGMK